jgi:hypothetical protein
MKGVRILIDDVAPSGRYGVCIGRAKPHRGAWWQLVSSFAEHRAAVRAFEALDPWKGRAWVDLDHEDIRPIDMAGKPVEPAEVRP